MAAVGWDKISRNLTSYSGVSQSRGGDDACLSDRYIFRAPIPTLTLFAGSQSDQVLIHRSLAKLTTGQEDGGCPTKLFRLQIIWKVMCMSGHLLTPLGALISILVPLFFDTSTPSSTLLVVTLYRFFGTNKLATILC